MLYNNTFILLGNLVLFGYSVAFENDTSIARILKSSELLRDTILISLCGAFGQIFIYLTINQSRRQMRLKPFFIVHRKLPCLQEKKLIIKT